jgi:hypothetical protein
MSIDYEIKDKQSIIDSAIENNSLKFLRHLWIIQNQKYSNRKLVRNTISSKDINNSILSKKKRSFIKYDRSKIITKKKIEFFNLSEILTMLKYLRRDNSIR